MYRIPCGLVSLALTGCKDSCLFDSETLGGSGREWRKVSFKRWEHCLRCLSWRTTGSVTCSRDQTGLWSESMMPMQES